MDPFKVFEWAKGAASTGSCEEEGYLKKIYMYVNVIVNMLQSEVTLFPQYANDK